MNNSLSSRVARVIAGGVHAIVDRIEDLAPLQVLEQSIRELDEITNEVRAELGQAITSRHLLQQQHLKLNTQHEALHESISVALSQGKDELAKSGVARQIDIEAQLPILESSLAESVQREQQCSSYVDALMGKKREMQDAIQQLAKAKSDLLSSVLSSKPHNPVEAKVGAVQDAFDRSYQRQASGVASASGVSLKESAQLGELSDLVREQKIAQRLASIKGQ
jgi:phage shock protein A